MDKTEHGWIHSFWCWLWGLRAYTYQHTEGPTVTVYARDRGHADARMRAFLRRAIYGNWALVYHPERVAAEFAKCELISSPPRGS